MSVCNGAAVMCGVCGIQLHDRTAQLHHYTTDYHTNNQARLLRGLCALSLSDYTATEGNIQEMN